MLSQRTVTGVLQDANGTLLANTVFYFTPIAGFGSGGVLIPPQPEIVTTNGSGVFSVDLNTKDEGSVTYQCTIGQWSFTFDLVAGDSITLDDLLNHIVPDTTAPTVPVMTIPSDVEDEQIRWNWNAATDDTAVVGYDLEVAEDEGFTVNVRSFSLGNVLTYLDTGRTIFTGYFARVRARDAVPNNSAYSPSVSVMTGIPTGFALSYDSSTSLLATWDAPPDATAPSVPTMTAATGITGTSITWNWNAATDDVSVTNYDLQVAEDSGFSINLRTIPLGSVLTYADTGVASDQIHYARVRARDGSGNASAYSSSVNATTTNPGADLLTSLISYWSLDEASGNALDAHGSNDLTDGNTVGAAAGKVNGARDFDGPAHEHFVHSDNADLSVGDIDFTFCCWVNLGDGTIERSIIDKFSGGNFEYRLTYQNSIDRFRFFVTADGSTPVLADDTHPVTPGTWYFIVVWHDAAANTVNIQVNNGTPVSTSHSGGVFAGTADFFIGGTSTADFWDGLIDEVGFWKRTLTTDEKTFLYNSGNGQGYSDLG